jgi:ABC-2 type transport system permease protein
MTLLRELVATDFKLRYQGSTLGYLWSLFRPLFLFGILLVVFGFILKIGSNIPHYPMYLLLGIVLWSFFVEATNNGLQSILSRGDLIRKISFPKYIIVISGTISALINVGISLIVVAIFFIFSGIEFRPIALLFPLLIVELYVFALAIAFFLSALYVKYRDITYIWELIIQAAFYATPILYPMSFVISKSKPLAKFMLLNPMAQIVQDSRYVLVSDQTTTLSQLTSRFVVVLIPFMIVIVMVIAAGAYFRKSSKYFAENV